jgi:hypothetical protein
MPGPGPYKGATLIIKRMAAGVGNTTIEVTGPDLDEIVNTETLDTQYQSMSFGSTGNRWYRVGKFNP